MGTGPGGQTAAGDGGLRGYFRGDADQDVLYFSCHYCLHHALSRRLSHDIEAGRQSALFRAL